MDETTSKNAGNMGLFTVVTIYADLLGLDFTVHHLLVFQCL